MSGLIWVQTVCKSYQQTTLVGKELNNGICLDRYDDKLINPRVYLDFCGGALIYKWACSVFAGQKFAY